MQYLIQNKLNNEHFYRKKLKNKKGFTLIELIVVMIIIGFLTAMAVPRFFNRQTYEGKGYFEKALNLMYFVQKVNVARGAMPNDTNTSLNGTDSAGRNIGFYSSTADSAYTKDLYIYVTPKASDADPNGGSIQAFYASRENKTLCASKNPKDITIEDFTDAKPLDSPGGTLSGADITDKSFLIKPSSITDIEQVKIQYLQYKLVNNKWTYTVNTDDNLPPKVFKFDAVGRVRDACNNLLISDKILNIAFKVEENARGSYYHVLIEPMTGYIHPGYFSSVDNRYETQTKCKTTAGGAKVDCTSN